MRLELREGGNYSSPDDPGEVGYAVREKRLSVTNEEGEILAGLAAGLRVLEIGTGLGVATRYLARTATEVVTVDIDPWVVDPCIANVTFMRDVPPGKTFDLAFIDGNHQYAEVIRDIQRAISEVIVLHDTYLDEVARAARDAGLHEVRIYPTLCRIGIYTK